MAYSSQAGEYVCEKCNNREFVFRFVPPHVGVYCAKCVSWKFWIPKKLFKNANVI